jgi:hypothetical protein
MVEPELNLRDIAAHLPAGPSFMSGADLWPRIAVEHRARRRRRHLRRAAVATFACVLVAGAIAFGWLPRSQSGVDWQARAQALEIEFNAARGAASPVLAADAESELARLDSALQAAYDRGAQPTELAGLWKRRSELLSALLAARQQQLILTRI